MSENTKNSDTENLDIIAELDPKSTAEFVSGATAELLHRGGAQRLETHRQQVASALGQSMIVGDINSSQLVKKIQQQGVTPENIATTADWFVGKGQQQKLIKNIAHKSTCSQLGKGTVDALAHVTPKTVSNVANMSNDAIVKTAASGAAAAASALGLSGASTAALVATASAAAPFVAIGGAAVAGGYGLYKLWKWMED